MKVSSINVVSLLFFFFVSSSFLCADAQSFSWSDCGVPGYRNIHYQSVTVSPYPAQTEANGSLSINVVATVINIIYEADTEIQVWQEGAQFLSVTAAPLCDIIQTTNALSCPIPVGTLSFTYTFTNLPDVPTGEYMVKIVSSVNGAELGCLQLDGEIEGAATASSCTYQSYANAQLNAIFNFAEQDASQRSVGSTFVIKSSSSDYASFTSYQSSPDLATSTSASQYYLNGFGTVTNYVVDNSNNVQVIHETYTGNFTIYYLLSGIQQTVYTGELTGYGVTNPNTNPSWTLTGNLTLDPQYVYFYGTPLASVFSYPLTLGNLNPFTLKSNGGSAYALSGSREWCTCAIDPCGVCGGDGSSCGVGTQHHGMSGKEQAAIAIGVGGGVIGILLVAVLALKVRKVRSAPLLNDTDLIDHPDKPDYGTMAIDEAIREGDRV